MVYFIQIKRLSFQKLAKVAQTKKQMDRLNRLACGYSIIRAADIHRFLSLSMLSQIQVAMASQHVPLLNLGIIGTLTSSTLQIQR